MMLNSEQSLQVDVTLGMIAAGVARIEGLNSAGQDHDLAYLVESICISA